MLEIICFLVQEKQKQLLGKSRGVYCSGEVKYASIRVIKSWLCGQEVSESLFLRSKSTVVPAYQLLSCCGYK